MNRRTFTTKSLQAASLLGLRASFPAAFAAPKPTVRLGGPLFGTHDSPDVWIAALQAEGYRAAYCPLKTDAPTEQIKVYKEAAQKANIVIAEVGAWSNPLSPDAETARLAFNKCVDSLALADAIEARCCVNISGSKNPVKWAGPHPDNLTEATFEQVVDVTRRIIKAVNPTRTYFTLELMPWSFPDSIDTYLRLLKAVNHKRFAVHLDPMNIISSPRSFFQNRDLIKDCFKKLGPYIKSCHGKDIILKDDVYTPQLVECRPGLGQMDYSTFLTELSQLNDVPLMMEHLDTAAAYQQAAGYIRSVGKKMGIDI